MIIAAKYSFNGGQEFIARKYRRLLAQIEVIVSAVDSNQHKTKSSKEKTMPGRMLFNPISLNKAFKKEFENRHWQTVRIACDYSM